MEPFAVICLLLLVACPGQQFGVENSYYTAAVVEYGAVGNISVHDPKQILMMNAENYVHYVSQAAGSGADIIVFPECGLSTIHLPETRDEIRPFLTPVPDPVHRKIPCTDTAEDVPEVLCLLSCTARNHSIYVVVNIPEIASCAGAECPNDGAFFYNTDIAFDRSGAIIATRELLTTQHSGKILNRYRKYNLFGEPAFNVTPTAETVTFDTDFGVRFGLAACFDIYFHDPIVQLVQKLGVRDIAFPVAWFSELPFLTAIQVQEGWSRALDVNLLASGYDDPANRNGGSGIYTGRLVRLAATMPFTKTEQLLISRVLKKTKGKFGDSADNVAIHSQSTNCSVEENRPPNFKSERIFCSDYLAPYTAQILETTETHTQICDRGLCCQFDIVTEGVTADSESVVYRAAVFNGIRPFFGGRTGGIQVCSVISCNNESLSSCGQAISTTERLTGFRSIGIQMNSSRVNSIHTPSTLLDSFLPLNADSYEFCSRNLTAELTRVHLRTTKYVRNLWTFGIYTREYDLDGLPFTVATVQTIN